MYAFPSYLIDFAYNYYNNIKNIFLCLSFAGVVGIS